MQQLKQTSLWHNNCLIPIAYQKPSSIHSFVHVHLRTNNNSPNQVTREILKWKCIFRNPAAAAAMVNEMQRQGTRDIEANSNSKWLTGCCCCSSSYTPLDYSNEHLSYKEGCGGGGGWAKVSLIHWFTADSSWGSNRPSVEWNRFRFVTPRGN